MAGVRLDGWTRTREGLLMPVAVTVETRECPCGTCGRVQARVHAVEVPTRRGRGSTVRGPGTKTVDGWNEAISDMMNATVEA